MASGRPKRETSSDSPSSAHFLDHLMAPPPPRATRSGRPSTTAPATTSPSSAPSKKRKQPDDPHFDDLFGPLPAAADEDVIDLVDTDVVPPPLKPPPPKNEIRLSAFQCVICMDDVTNLTVTHCGTSPSPPPLPPGWLTDSGG